VLLFIAYVLPALVTYHRKVISLAELLAYGYATLLSGGGRMSSNFNIGQYTRSDTCSYSNF
jgi:hypothetical protein